MKNIKQDVLNAKILIIEGDDLERLVLREIFKKQGFTHIDESENNSDALAKIQGSPPDLVIMDVGMLEADGMEFCNQIRQNSNPQIAEIPILVQTVMHRISDRTRLFAAGATDYITKPIDPHEITARAIVHIEHEIITNRLREFNARVAQELDIARVTQQVLIPNKHEIKKTEADYNLQICGHYQPSSELGGDFWGFKSISCDELAIYIGDFSGHGVNAALNVFRLHTLMQTAIDTALCPASHLSHLNAILAPLLPVGQFATMFYGIINNKKNTLSYASAASPPPILFSGKNANYKLLDAGETLLGAAHETAYKTTEVAFNSGDFLLLYSDALTETPNENGEMQPIENWAEMLQKSMKLNGDCSEYFADLLANFEQTCATNLHDDLTLSGYFSKHLS